MYSGNKNIKNTFLIQQYFATYVAFSSSIKIDFFFSILLVQFLSSNAQPPLPTILSNLLITAVFPNNVTLPKTFLR